MFVPPPEVDVEGTPGPGDAPIPAEVPRLTPSTAEVQALPLVKDCLPLALGRGFPAFVALATASALFLGYLAYTWGVSAHGTGEGAGARVFELNGILWMPYALQDSTLIVITQSGARAVINDPRLTNPVLLVETVLYWCALAIMASAALVNAVGAMVLRTWSAPEPDPTQDERVGEPDAGPRGWGP